MLSYQTTLSREEKKKNIEESVRVWDKGTDFGFPNRDTSWAYVVRALISEQRATLQATDVSQQRRWLWESAAFAERALLLYDVDAFAWSCLGRYHRFLGNEANALQATEKGWKLDSENLAVQEERAAILANVGEVEAAAEAIDKRRDAAQGPWADSVKAYLLAEQRQYKEALSLIRTAIEAEPEVFWYLDLRARCFRMLGQPDRALEDYKTLWSHYDAKNLSDQVVFGVSAYYVGEIEQAIRIFSDYLATDDDLSGYWYLGACQLAQNNLEEGEKSLARSVAVTKNTRQLGDILEEELPTLEKTSKGWSHQVQVVGILQRIREQIIARRVELQAPPSPENELRKAIDHPARADGPDVWRQIAVQAGLGRLYNEAGQHDAAATAYRELVKFRDKFPEVGIGLHKVATGFAAKGDGLLKSGDPASAIRQFSNGLDVLSDDTPKGMTDQANLRSRLGLAHLLASDPQKARPEFRQALELNRKLGTKHPGLVLGETCRGLLSDPKQYWALDDEWNSCAREVRDGEALKIPSCGPRVASGISGGLAGEAPSRRPRIPDSCRHSHCDGDWVGADRCGHQRELVIVQELHSRNAQPNRTGSGRSAPRRAGAWQQCSVGRRLCFPARRKLGSRRTCSPGNALLSRSAGCPARAWHSQ